MGSEMCIRDRLEVEGDLDLGDADRRLAGDLETAIYRLVQEALTNVAKHARATRVEVAVRAIPGAVDVRVVDDGVGVTAGGATGGGFGLVGMRERVAMAGGELQIERGDGGGTVVRARLPAPS